MTVNLRGASALDHQRRLRAFFADQRGAQDVEGVPVPRTTNADVMRLAGAWSRELARVPIASDRDRTARARWAACMATVRKLADPARPDQEYAANRAFWLDCTAQLSNYLAQRKARPSTWSLVVDAASDTLAEVPGALGDASKAAAGAAAGLVKEPAKLALVLLGGALLLPPLVKAVRS